jgi:glycosyltransferase involved in cell wall biosynthesis
LILIDMSKQIISAAPKIRIVQLTTVHHREDTRIALRECPELAKIWGPELILVVSDGKGNGFQGNVRIVDVGKPAGGRIGRAILGGMLAFRTVRRHKPECLHFHDPELIPVGILCKMMGLRVVYDVHEWVPTQIMRKYWLPVILRRPVALLTSCAEQMAGRWVDRIVAATPEIGRRFPPEKTVLIQNFPIIGELEKVVGITYEDRPPEFAYIGGITRFRSAVEMIQAIGKLGSESDVMLHMAGIAHPAELMTELEERAGWKHVTFHGWAGRAKVAEILGRARAGIVLCYPYYGFVDSQPVKLFEYMSAGLPVIASNFPLWRKIIEGAGAGLVVDPQDPEAVYGAMKWILDNPKQARKMGVNGKRAVEETYNWKKESGKLIAMYRDLFAMQQGTNKYVT